MKTVCDLYRSPREEEMYLYVDKREGTASVPEKLLELFGRPEHLMTMLLTPGKKLARAEADRVMKEIRERGYYLQTPPRDGGSAENAGADSLRTPARDDEMRAIAAQNSKLQR